MNHQLLAFFKALEAALPPPDKCHHVMHYAKYGSDEDGWQDQLAVTINYGEKLHCVFIDDGDFDKHVDELVGEIADFFLNGGA